MLVTAGAGFIGAAVVRRLARYCDRPVVNVDKLTYAADARRVADLTQDRHILIEADITDRASMTVLFQTQRPSAVVHLAAETHVDRSIEGSADFIATNVTGTHVLLESARAYWNSLSGDARERFRFLHVSTDEVYGALGPVDPPFSEDHPYRPNSPYAASKAASDHLARAWHETYGLPVIISNCSNNYGPWQFPEKLIPLMIAKASVGEPMPVYGTGQNVRDWLHVDDHAQALIAILECGVPGRTYNIGGGAERANLEVVETICAIMDDLVPKGAPHRRLVSFVTDRPGHDFRYAVDCSRVRNELGWQPRRDFETGLRETVLWYQDNASWWRGLWDGGYRGQRLGLIACGGTA